MTTACLVGRLGLALHTECWTQQENQYSWSREHFNFKVPCPNPDWLFFKHRRLCLLIRAVREEYERGICGPMFNITIQPELPGLRIWPRKAAEQMEVLIFRKGTR